MSAAPGDDAVREERAPRRREEVALVAPEREEREAVAPVRVDERARDAALPHRLRDRVRERAQPEAQRAECEARIRARRRRRRAGRELAAVQLDSDATAATVRERRQRGRAGDGVGRGLARHVEASPVAERARRAARASGRLLDVEALRQVRDGGGERRRATASCQARRRRRASERDEPDEGDAEGESRDARSRRNPGRQDCPTSRKRSPHLRRQRRDDPDHSDGRPPTRASIQGWASAASRLTRVLTGVDACSSAAPAPAGSLPLPGALASSLIAWTL